MALVRILVVDDQEPFRRFICQKLRQRAEFQIIGQASDGLQAVEKAAELQPDLVLLDIGMPKLNGLEAAKRILVVNPQSKILIVSQEPSSDVMQEALNLGALGYVLKIHAQTELMPAIEAALQVYPQHL